jgi:hypothetical protein
MSCIGIYLQSSNRRQVRAVDKRAGLVVDL